jgi:hypothetical protein
LWWGDELQNRRAWMEDSVEGLDVEVAILFGSRVCGAD